MSIPDIIPIVPPGLVYEPESRHWWGLEHYTADMMLGGWFRWRPGLGLTVVFDICAKSEYTLDEARSFHKILGELLDQVSGDAGGDNA